MYRSGHPAPANAGIVELRDEQVVIGDRVDRVLASDVVLVRAVCPPDPHTHYCKTQHMFGQTELGECCTAHGLNGGVCPGFG